MSNRKSATVATGKRKPDCAPRTCCAALVEAYEAYIILLSAELNEVVPMAANHGWQTSRKELGETARAKIEKLKAQHNDGAILRRQTE